MVTLREKAVVSCEDDSGHDTGSLRDVQNHFRFIQWDITARCNLRCIHCRSETFYGSEDLERDLPLSKVVARLDDLCAKGIRRIHFLGGEPLSRRDLPRIVEHATKLGILCSVNTNGTLLTQKSAEALVAAGTYLITFSIDGATPEINDAIRGRDTFRRVVRGIGLVRDARQRLRGHTRLICSHVLMRPNVAHVADMIDLCTSLGLQNLIVTHLRKMGGAIERFNELAVSPEERFQAAEALVRKMIETPKRCNVQVEIVSLLGKLYLNAKYKAGLPVERGGCDAVATKAYVQPDGALFPCQDVAKAVGKLGERDAIRGEGLAAWDARRFSNIAFTLSSLEVYERYAPCRVCPALGKLCVPCPLPGLRGQRFAQEDCQRVLARAKRDAIDLTPALDEAIKTSAAARLASDPMYRRQFLAAEDPDQFIDAQCGAASERERILSVRDRTLAEMQRLLQDAAAGQRREVDHEDAV